MAGEKNCDYYIRSELEEAKVPIVATYDKHPEVSYSIGGSLFGWKMRRQWRYWSVSKTPGLALPAAIKLFDLDTNNVIRVVGHCASPHPKEWTEAYNLSGYIIIPDPKAEPRELFDKFKVEHGMFSWDNDTSYEYINSYHIDTQAGLNLWAKIIKNTEVKIHNALSGRCQ